jgi:hypothetical protein
VNRLRDNVKGKLLLKGILTQEDAVLATKAGIDAIIVSNHGGRFGDNGRAAIDALPEIVEAVGGRMPVLIDSGFRRGTDVVKALALGARAICIGRTYGGSPPSARAGSSGFSTSCARRRTPRCSTSAPRRCATLRPRWCVKPDTGQTSGRDHRGGRGRGER